MLDGIIVGGGITGLTVAYELSLRGLQGVLVEAEDRLGGKICTLIEDGFVVEMGPDAMVTLKPEALALCTELGLANEVIPARTLPAYVIRARRFYPIPSGLFALVPGQVRLRDIRWVSWRGRLRAAGLPFQAFLHPVPPDADAPVGPTFRRWAGTEFTTWVVEPLLAGVYGGDIDRLSLRATLPQVTTRRTESLRSLLRSRPKPSGMPETPFRSLRGGLVGLVQRLRERFGSVEARTGVPVEGAYRSEAGWVVETAGRERWQARHLVLAVSPRVAARLLREAAPDVADLLGQAVSEPVAVIAYAWPGTWDWLGTGFLVPRAERRWITACTWLSQKWPGRAPTGWNLVRVFLTGSTPTPWMEMDDETLTRTVWQELMELVDVPAVPHRVWVQRWTDGLPQYTVGHLKWVETVEQAIARYPGLHVAGAGYRGVGLSDCIRQARQVAYRIS
ncbi:MAG: protoporphyrinogen oxidase [Acidobacteria bacterium]|nr:protoporphyrinogen oxidase [Acidobacteriota bacterium]MDW7984410.1 protoporphyrinogen oxidase [Acidobacteriota bacterium]